MVHNTDISWTKTVTRPLSVLKITTMFEGLESGIDEEVDVQLKNHLFEPVDDKHAWYLDKAEWNAFTQEVAKQGQDLGFLQETADRAFNICEELIATTEDISDQAVEDLTNEELADLLNNYHSAFYKIPFVLFGVLVLEQTLNERLNNRLEETLTATGSQPDFDEYFDKLTTKIKLIDAEKEEIDLLKIKAELQDDAVDKDDALAEHANKYGWLPTYDHNLGSWGPDHFEQKLKDLPDNPHEEIKRRKAEIEDQEAAIEKILDELDDPELRTIVDVLQDYLVLRTFRTDAMRQAYYNTDSLFKEIGRRMGLKGDNYSYLKINEIYAFLKDRRTPSKEDIQNRSEGFLLLKVKDEVQILTENAEIKSIVESEIDKQEVVEELSGTGVHQGIVEGTVRIVESPEEGKKVSKGDILVSSMTTPEMHSIINRVDGIVTDEGGLTSHAAVISRELEIPCVIGTEAATESLEDGDAVKIDAEKGVVIRLE